MAGYEEFPSPDDRLEGSPEEHQGLLAETVSALITRDGFDARLAEAYTPEASRLYAYPGMGPALASHLNEAKLMAVLDLHDLHEEAFRNHFEFPEMRRVAEQLQQEIGAGGQDISHERLLALMVHGTAFGAYLDQAEQGNLFGLRRHPLVRSVIQANYLHYFGLLPATDAVIQDEGAALAEISDFAFGGSRPGTPLLASDVALHLRLRGVVDLGRTHLDARRASLHAIVQLAATAAILGELSYLPVITPGTGARIATDLARTYEDALKADDFDGKIAAAKAVATVFRQHEQRMRNRLARRFANAIASDAEAVADDLPIMRVLFLPVYRRLGYGPPATPAGEAVGEELPDEAAVRARATDFGTQWRFTSRERRTRGFAQMQRVLVTGELDTGNGVQRITAVTKEQARQLVDLLGKLNDRVVDQTADEARTHLQSALQEQRSLTDAVRRLTSAARATGQPFNPVEIPPIDTLLELLRANWSDYRQLVRSTWPEGRGAAAAHAVETLLFDDEERHREEHGNPDTGV